MTERGWWLTLSSTNAAEAHYFDASAGTLCGFTEGPLSTWNVAAHVGRVALCEECKRILRKFLDGRAHVSDAGTEPAR